MSAIAAAILSGDHDGELREIEHALKYRRRVSLSSFKRNSRVRIVGSGGRIDGCFATVEKVNQKTVTVKIEDTHERWRVSPQVLEAVEA